MSVFTSPLVSVEDLAQYAEVGGQEPFPGHLLLLDVRWRLGSATNYDDYLAGHLPGAVWVDLDHDLADPPTAAAGRHPLPSLERLQVAATRWGLEDDSTVVAYDGDSNYVSARLWWVLGDAGLTNVHLLDGAWPAWLAAERPTATGPHTPPPGHATIGPVGQWAQLDIDGAAAWPSQGILLDARGRERYLGLTEPVDPRAGHIPGAVSAPTGQNVTESGHFLSPAALRERFEGLGVSTARPTAAYCGSGVTASHQVFALRLAGFDAALYPGSWSQWSATDRPAVTGDGSSVTLSSASM